RDAKAQALRTGELGTWDMHELLDAAKEERARLALESAGRLEGELPTSAECSGGFAGPYPCENVDLAAVVPLAELGGVAGNDSWGWTDPENDNEIAIVGTGTGVAFVDVTTPTDPVVLGRVQSRGGTQVEARPAGSVQTGVDYGTVWRDVKVDGNYAFIVSENYEHGMQVFDLTRLRDHYGTHNPANLFPPDHVDTSFGSAHNIVINPDSDTAYVVGSNVCAGGLHMIDISNPTDTKVAGCYDGDGYVHDAQCVFYHGPDERFSGLPDGADEHAADNAQRGREICFANIEERGVAIVDVTDKANPEQLASVGYTTAAYSHQGWLTPDHRYYVFNDEVDEQAGTVDNTTTYVLDLTTDKGLKLGEVAMGDKKGLISSYSHDTVTTDHNLYITDANERIDIPVVWEANYNAGLQILTYSEDGIADAEFERIGYFRVDSFADAPHYGDAWNVYPFFESGTVILSNLGQGLVVLQPDYEGLSAAAAN
ncbi:MAG: choice-of-anchor B family protein, partial [Nitriliruptorales bacterium]|nr:choice-of-anchor B family protein [Nitriliruptorales bacterium]